MFAWININFGNIYRTEIFVENFRAHDIHFLFLSSLKFVVFLKDFSKYTVEKEDKQVIVWLGAETADLRFCVWYVEVN